MSPGVHRQSHRRQRRRRRNWRPKPLGLLPTAPVGHLAALPPQAARASAGQLGVLRAQAARASLVKLAQLSPESFSSALAAFLRDRAEHLVSEAKATMRQAHLEHYEKDGLTAMRQRLSALLEVTLSCLATGEADPIIDHTTRVARERFSAGYDLLEVQTSINTIEEVLWRRILASIPPEEMAHALGLVSGLLGLGKDALARTYVALARQQAQAADGPPDDSGLDSSP